MLCPVCKVDLKLAERQGIEIDYCPKCRGVWLDRSELDQIIKRSNAGAHGADEEDEDDARVSDRDRKGRRRNRDDEDDEEGGFLGNLFGGFGGGRDD